MAISEGLWSDDVDRLINRIEIRLEQYKLHADSLELGSRDRERADALVTRLEYRLLGLRLLKEQRRHRWRDRSADPGGRCATAARCNA